MPGFTKTAALAAFVTITAATSLRAQDMTGRWLLAVELDAGSGDATFQLTQDGNTLTGSYSGALGEEPVTGTIADGTIELTFDSQAGTITYTGTIKDGVFSGTCEYGQLGSGTFRGRKTGGQRSDLRSHDSRNPTPMPPDP